MSAQTNAGADTSATTGRTAELEFTIDAKVEDVWAAITEAEHLMNWFPLEARVTPGEGGTMFMAWGEEFKGDCTIEVWEPSKRLRTTFMEQPSPDSEPMRTFVDYFLEGDGGVTKLRLVHSGFGEGAAWDAMYNAVSNGWNAELRSLKHYVENHLSQTREVAWAVSPIKSDDEAAWAALLGPDCLGLEGVVTPSAGERYSANGPALGEISGLVLHSKKPGVFVATIDGMDNAFIRVEIERCTGPDPSVWFWVSLYGDSASGAKALKQRIEQTLASLVA